MLDAPRRCGARDDPYLFPVVTMGGAGAISASAHLATQRFVAMIEHGLAGRLAQGRDHAEALLVLALFAEPSPAVIKGVLHAEGRIRTPDVRMRLSNASKTALHHANDTLQTLGSRSGPRIRQGCRPAR